MSLLFNMLSRSVIAFLSRSKHLLISWLQLPSTVILEPKKIKFVTVSIVCPSICHEVMGLDAMILKLNVQKTRIMASGPITSQKIDGEKMETTTDFIFLGSRITVDGDCSHEIKRHLLLGRKAITNLECIKKQRHYLANKGPSSQSYGFSSSYVWM